MKTLVKTLAAAAATATTIATGAHAADTCRNETWSAQSGQLPLNLGTARATDQVTILRPGINEPYSSRVASIGLQGHGSAKIWGNVDGSADERLSLAFRGGAAKVKSVTIGLTDIDDNPRHGRNAESGSIVMEVDGRTKSVDVSDMTVDANGVAHITYSGHDIDDIVFTSRGEASYGVSDITIKVCRPDGNDNDRDTGRDPEPEGGSERGGRSTSSVAPAILPPFRSGPAVA